MVKKNVEYLDYGVVIDEDVEYYESGVTILIRVEKRFIDKQVNPANTRAAIVSDELDRAIEKVKELIKK